MITFPKFTVQIKAFFYAIELQMLISEFLLPRIITDYHGLLTD